MTATAALIRKNITSLYEQIAEQLREEVLAGIFEPSGKLPSEAKLMVRFAVSRVTVRLALGRLEEDGIVERKQGKGTYAAGKRVRHALDALRSFHDSLLIQGLRPEMKLLVKEKMAVPEHLEGRLEKESGYCTFMQRLHLVDGEPIAVGKSYLPARVAEIEWDEAEQQPNYAILRNIYGHSVVHADVAIRAQLADRDLATLLKVNSGSALLVMTRTSSAVTGECCDYSTFYIRPERYEFVASCSFHAG